MWEFVKETAEMMTAEFELKDEVSLPAFVTRASTHTQFFFFSLFFSLSGFHYVEMSHLGRCDSLIPLLGYLRGNTSENAFFFFDCQFG